MTRVTTPDRFAIDLTEMVNDMANGVERRLPKAVAKAADAGVTETRKHAPVRDASHESVSTSATKPPPGSYRDSITRKVTKSGDEVRGEVGSKQYPGLVHLLEKGHATMGGGFVAPRPHVIFGKEEADDTLVRELGMAIDQAMESI